MQLLLGNAVGSLRIQERKIIITHTHPAKGTNCSSYPSYAFFLLEKSLNWGWRELQEVLENYTAQVTRIHVCCWDRWKGGDSLPFLTHFCWPWVQPKGCWGVVWELSQESLLMSSLCYLFLYSYLIPTIGRKLGPWEVKLQKWHPGRKPTWGVSSLTVQGTFHRPVCILVVMLLWTDQVSYFAYIMYPSLLWPTQVSGRSGRRVTSPTVQRCSALWLCLTNLDRTAPKLDKPTEGEQINQRKSDLCFPDPTSEFP